jgi:hypothetical protein
MPAMSRKKHQGLVLRRVIWIFFHRLTKMPALFFSFKCKAYRNVASFVLFVVNANLRPWET